jgi:hypothetical protein
VTYRDDREQLIARNEALDAELGAAREEIARLRGGGVRFNRWLGGPTRIEIEREVAGELQESAIEDVVVDLRSRFGVPGRIERLGHTVSWYTDPTPRGGGRRVAVHFTVRDGETRLRVEESIAQLAGGLFGGIVGGAGGAGSINLLVWGFITGNVLLLLGAVGWLALVYFIVRAAYAAVSQKRARELEGFGAEIEDRLRRAVAENEQKKLRVSDETDVEAEEAEEASDPASARAERH